MILSRREACRLVDEARIGVSQARHLGYKT